jgi:PAS domain S-box-containing protein
MDFGLSELLKLLSIISLALYQSQNGPTDFAEEAEVNTPEGDVIDVYDYPFTDVDGSPLILEMDVDITARRRAEAALREAGEYNRSLIEASIDPLVTIGSDGRITDVNAATENATGRSRSELVGTDFSDYFTDPERARAGYQQVFREGKVQDYPLEIHHRDGRTTPVLYNATVYRGSDGAVAGVFAAARDITERRQAEAALKHANETLERRVNERTAELQKENTERRRAEEALRILLNERERLLESERAARGELGRANRLKDEFLANLSHELRTPLNAILGWTQILRREHSDAESIGKGLEVIERNTRIQEQLVSDLLDLNRILSGKMRLQVQNFDPVTALEAAIDTLAPAVEAKRITVEKLIEPLPGPVLGDPDRLQQVFWNLFSNAIKFTPPKGRVQIVMRRTDSRIEIVFRDTGQGISQDFLPHIFERFRQADSSTSKTHGGLGLGLAIVRHLVELHGGTVKAESPGDGQGATFIVTLPLIALKAEYEPGAGGTSEDMELEIALDGLKVLYVDDEADTREMIKRLLEQRGAAVVVADCAAKGIALFQESRPDVLIGDIGMPGEDGYEMIRKIRQLPSEVGGQTQAIALTAYSRMEDRTRAILAGYQYHLAKPVEALELIATLGMILQRLPKRPGNS